MKYTFNHLLTRVLEKGDIATLRRIPLVILNDVEQQYYKWIFDYTRTYTGNVPTLEIFREEVGKSFVPKTTKDDVPLAYIFDKVVPDLQIAYIKRARDEQLQRYSENPDRELNPDSFEWHEKTIALARVAKDNIINYNDLPVDAYLLDAKRLETNNTFIKETINCIYGTDLIYIVGRQKNQKTHTARALALELSSRGYNGIIFTNEISSLEFSAYNDGILGGVNPNFFYTGKLTDEEKIKLEHARAKRQKAGFGKIIIAGTISEPSDIVGVLNSIDTEIDYVLVDGVDFMASGRDQGEASLSYKAISNGFKRFSLKYNIPVIATLQLNRTGAHTDEPDPTMIAGSDQFGRDATAVYSTTVVNTPFGEMAAIYTVLNRRGYAKKYYQETNWNTMEIRYYRTRNSDLDVRVAATIAPDAEEFIVATENTDDANDDIFSQLGE